MGWTKRQFIDAAFAELGMSVYTFDMQPEQYQYALHRLDSMLAEWNERGVRLGYPIPLSPQQSDLDEQTNVPDRANEAILTNLATRIAPSYGKQVMPQTMATAQSSLNTIMRRAAMPQPMQMPRTMPSGAGNKPWIWASNPFVNPPVDPVLAGEDGPIDYE